jgi:hypothetical protein
MGGSPPGEKMIRVYKFLSAEFGMKSLRERRIKISTVDDLNDPFELMPFELSDKRARSGLMAARETWSKTRGVLCFSADWRDPVIWSHYSDKHKGLCLGFDLPDNVTRAVTYVDGRLALGDSMRPDMGQDWLYTKYNNWSYEREIRS